MSNALGNVYLLNSQEMTRILFAFLLGFNLKIITFDEVSPLKDMQDVKSQLENNLQVYITMYVI